MDELSSNWCECTLIYVNPIINNVQTTILVYTGLGMQSCRIAVCPVKDMLFGYYSLCCCIRYHVISDC